MLLRATAFNIQVSQFSIVTGRQLQLIAPVAVYGYPHGDANVARRDGHLSDRSS
jgi:hypothetical protein